MSESVSASSRFNSDSDILSVPDTGTWKQQQQFQKSVWKYVFAESAGKEHKHARSGDAGQGEGEPMQKVNETCRGWSTHIARRSIEADQRPRPRRRQAKVRGPETRNETQRKAANTSKTLELAFGWLSFDARLGRLAPLLTFNWLKVLPLCIRINFRITPEILEIQFPLNQPEAEFQQVYRSMSLAIYFKLCIRT